MLETLRDELRWTIEDLRLKSKRTISKQRVHGRRLRQLPKRLWQLVRRAFSALRYGSAAEPAPIAAAGKGRLVRIREKLLAAWEAAKAQAAFLRYRIANVGRSWRRALARGVVAFRRSPADFFRVAGYLLTRNIWSSIRAIGEVVAVLPHASWVAGRLAARLPHRLARYSIKLARLFYRTFLGIVRWFVRRFRRLARTWTRMRRSITRFFVFRALVRDEIHLLRHGYAGAGPYPEVPEGSRITSATGTVYYMSYNSLPYHSAGYATRSQGLVAGLRELGIDGRILTRLGYPRVFVAFREIDVPPSEDVGSVPYLRLDSNEPTLWSLSKKQYLDANIAASIGLIRSAQPALIHGASNYITGITAVEVAKALGLPSIYEVRGLWEVTALSRDPSYGNTLHYAQAVRLETDACLGASHVIAITGALKEEMVRRGVPPEKITVIPNGVDTGRFRSRERDTKLATKLGLTKDHVVIGYVGSILDYEGLDDVLHAFRRCIDAGATNFRCLIVGDGAAFEDIKSLAQELELNDYVIFTGRVPHDQVERYYSLIDITPFSRKPLPVCEMVSPLKPFEAMAMGKCVIVSSVAALKEIVTASEEVGIVHEKGSIESLAAVLMEVYSDPDRRRRLGAAARRFVVAERDWRMLSRQVARIYRDLLDRAEEADAGSAPPARAAVG